MHESVKTPIRVHMKFQIVKNYASLIHFKLGMCVQDALEDKKATYLYNSYFLFIFYDTLNTGNNSCW